MLGMIVSGALFLMLSTTMKTRSFWNEYRPKFRVLKDRIVNDVWRERSSSDFLQYLKFEFIQYTYHGSYVAVGLGVMP